MLELNNALDLIVKNIDARLKEYGFSVIYPDGVRPGQTPVTKTGDKSVIRLKGNAGRIKIEYCDGKLALFCATAADEELSEEEMPRVSLTLLELDSYDERDLKYIYEEYNETLTQYFGIKPKQTGKQRLPAAVSKAAAKSGALSYDLTTLGLRFVKIYPELMDEYTANIAKYEEFLAEEFFVEHGNKLVLDTIRENDKIKMRRLFNLLNEIYEDGTNETQSLIAVTIFGQLYSEPELAERALDAMSETMRGPVSKVIEYLSSAKSKGAKMRLQNPPPYKPPKKQRQSIMSKLTGM